MSLEPRNIPDKSREMLLLSKRELERITSQLGESAAQRKAAKAATEERKALKDKSKKMTDKWENTIAGFTKARLKHVQLAEEAVESERKKIDDIEGQYQELRRRYVLDVAKKRLYQQTDRVKRLQAAKNFAEILKERDDQHVVQEKAKHVFDDFDNEYTRSLLDDVDKYHEEQVARARREKLDNQQFAAELIKQYEYKQKVQEKAREEDFETTRLLQEQATQYQKEDQQLSVEEKQHREQYRNILDEEIAKKKHMESVLRKMDEAEDERANLFTEAKRKMKNIHIENQKKLNKLKDEKQTELAKTLKDVAGRIRKKEEKILKRAIRQKEAKEKEQEERKEAERTKALQEIDAFTQKAIAAKEQAKLDEKTKRLHEGIHLKDLYDFLTAEEERKQREKKEQAKQNEHIMKHQMDKRKGEEAAKTQHELEDYARHMKSLLEEEETFQKYAKELIKECEAKGLPTYPLKKAALPGIECGKGPLRKERGNIRPKYYASVTDPDELHYVTPKPKATSSVTKARLGFCD